MLLLSFQKKNQDPTAAHNHQELVIARSDRLPHSSGFHQVSIASSAGAMLPQILQASGMTSASSSSQPALLNQESTRGLSISVPDMPVVFVNT